jgi:hypothetical protein
LTPTVESAVLADCHVVVNTDGDVYDGIVVVRKLDLYRLREEVGIGTVLECGMVFRETKLAGVRATTGKDFASCSQEQSVMLSTSDLNNLIIAQVLLTETDNLGRELDQGVIRRVKACSCLTHAVQAPSPNVTILVDCKRVVNAATDDDGFPGPGAEDNFFWNSSMDFPALKDFTTELALFTGAPGIDVAVGCEHK